MDGAVGMNEFAALDRNELEHEHRALIQRYSDLVSRNPAGVYRTTLDGDFLECNDAMAWILGYADRAELMAVPASSLYASDQERDRFVKALSETGRLLNFELTLKHRTGRPVEVLENVFLEQHKKGVATIQGTLVDITAKRMAEMEQASLMASYRSLVEHMRDGVLVVVEGVIHYANPAAQELLGSTLVSTSMVEQFTIADQHAINDLLKGRDTADGAPMQVRLRKNHRELILHAVHVLHNGENAVQFTIIDEEAHRGLVQERLRVQMAEEVNQVLRKEIEEHRRTQEALGRSKRFTRSLVDSSLDMIMAADPEGSITEYNPAASLRFGYEPEEVMGTGTHKLYADPTEHARIQAELAKYGSFTGEVRNITKDGEVFTSFLAASRMFDEEGRLLGAMGVSRDITLMKKDQEALRASEERYRDLFESATNLIQSVDTKGRFQYVNEAWKKALGYDEEELKGLTLYDIIHPDHLEHCKGFFARLMEGEGPSTIRTVFRSKTGAQVQVEGTSNVHIIDGVPIAARTILTDVTRSHRAQEQVEQHQAKLRALFESSEHMFWTVDRSLKLTSYNVGYGDMIERLHGKRPEINLDPSKPRSLFADPDYHAWWETKYNVALGGKAIRFETDREDVNGERVCNEIFLSPVFGADGNVVEVFGVGHEVTEQKLAEDLVRKQAARLKAIFENAANVMIWTLDRNFRITSFNDHFQYITERHMGLHFEYGDDFIAIMRERLVNGPNDPVVAKYRSGVKGVPQQFEVELFGHTGKRLWVETFLNPIDVDGEVSELSCMAYGITDRKEAELQLRQSLGEKEVLLKEVHHRVKNNLQVISSILSLQTAHVDGDQRILELLRVSRDRIRSMSFIHESLYQNKDFSSIDMATYIDGLSRNLVMSYSLSGKVTLERDLQKTELVLDQAIPCGLILNELISNALKHAFPNGKEGRVHIGLSTEENEIRITVSDNGTGLAEGFDTERDGNLGLELVHTLVEQLDGRLEVSSGQGVTYLLTFGRNT